MAVNDPQSLVDLSNEGLELWRLSRDLWDRWIDGSDDDELQARLRATLDRIEALRNEPNGAGDE